MKHQIKHRYTDAVLFECDVPEDVQASGIAARYTLENAVKDHANLRGANLSGAHRVAEARMSGPPWRVALTEVLGSACGRTTGD